jgi:hypothetical protein
MIVFSLVTGKSGASRLVAPLTASGDLWLDGCTYFGREFKTV